MKKLFIYSALLVGLASCSTVSQTSKSLDVATTAESYNMADLIVSPSKTSYTMQVTRSDRSLGDKAVKEKAVAQTLKQAGNGDVMVAPEFEILRRRGKIRRITVTGYPATYKNFKAAAPACPK